MDQGEVHLVGGGVGRQSTLQINLVDTSAVQALLTSVRELGLLRIPVGDFDPPIRTDVAVVLSFNEATVELAGHIVDWGNDALVELNDPLDTVKELIGGLDPSATIEATPWARSDHPLPHFLEDFDFSRPITTGKGDGNRAISMVAAQQQSGHTLLAADGETGSWYFFAVNGVITHAHYSPETHWSCILGLLERQGKLDAGQVADLRAESIQRCVPAEVALGERKVLPDSLIDRARQAKVQLATRKLETQKSVEFSIHEVERPPHGLETSPTGQSLLARLNQAFNGYHDMDRDAARDAQAPLLSSRPALVRSAEDLVAELELPETAARFLRMVDGSKALNIVFRTSPLGHDKSFALLFALMDLDLVTMDGDAPPKRKMTQPSEVAAVTEPPKAPARPKHETLVIDRFAAMSSPSLFDRLGVHWSAGRDKVAEAAAKLRQDLEAAVTAGLPDDLVLRANEISTNISGWAARLSNTSQRRQHRARIVGREVMTQEIEALDANFETALEAGQRSEVARILGQIREIDPTIVQQRTARAAARL